MSAFEARFGVCRAQWAVRGAPWGACGAVGVGLVVLRLAVGPWAASVGAPGCQARSGTHNSNLSAKVALRRKIPRAGWIWMPFCGFGEMQQLVGWSPARIAGCDLDRDAVAHWQKTWPDAEVRCVDVEKFTFDSREYAVADVDAFGNPWRAVEHFLSDAHTARRVVVLATDWILKAARHCCERSARTTSRRISFEQMATHSRQRTQDERLARGRQRM